MLTLTDDQAKLLGSRAVLEVHRITEGDAFQGMEPAAVVELYEKMEPHVELIRWLPQVKPEDVDLARRLMEDALKDARKDTSYERRCLERLQAGEHGCLYPGRSFEQSEAMTRDEIALHEKRETDASAVLALLPEAVMS